MATHRVGAIMHFAASIIVPESVRDPLAYYRNNSSNARNLLDAAVQAEVPHFLFSSTAAVYGVPPQIPIAEDMPKAPINPYGRSKWVTEMMLADVAHAHPMNYCALRYFNVAGADPMGRAGQCTKNATHLIKIAVEAALGKRPYVSICGTDYATSDGTGVRDYIHVSDLADAHVLALQALINEPQVSMVMNCGYGRGVSVLEVIDAVERVSGRAIVRHFEGRRPGDPDTLIADNQLITRRLGWQPRFQELDKIVADALAWEKTLLA
jgi:UDP-glucose 4-epimerase